MRYLPIGSAVLGLAVGFTAHAVPISYSQDFSVSAGAWIDSHQVDRYGDFSDSTNNDFGFNFGGFDTSRGALQSVQLSMVGVVSHRPVSVSLPEVSGLPISLPFGAIAQDTERTLQGPGDLWAYYDAQVSWRADFRFAVDPVIDGLFTPIAAEAGFGSCSGSAELFLDIGDRNPYCYAQNTGVPLTPYFYDWGTITGTALDAFLNPGGVTFNLNLMGDVYGHCDNDDVGDYCRLNLATYWDTTFYLTYTYDDGTDPGGGGGNGEENPVPVPEPATMGLLGMGLLAAFMMRRRRLIRLLAD